MRNCTMIGLAALLAGAEVSASEPAEPSAVQAPSAEMTVASFLERVGELRTRGPEWTLSPEAAELFGAVSQAGKSYRDELRQRQEAGQPVEACLPPEAEIDSDVLFRHLASYPPAEAGRTRIRDAFADLVRKSYPCP